MNLTRTELIVTALVILISVWLLAPSCHAQEAQSEASHKFELGVTDMGIPLIMDIGISSFKDGRDYCWFNHLAYGGFCVGYRATEGAFDGNQHALCKLEGDLTCDGVAYLIWVLSPPAKEKK